METTPEVTPPKPGKIYGAILAIMRDIKAIGKDRYNSGQKYNFRGVDDVFNEAHPLFAEHGVFITAKTLEEKREERESNSGGVLNYTILKIEYTFQAEDGSSVTMVMIGEGMDSGDKSSNKAMSVAIKYAVMQILMIPTEDSKDPEDSNPDPRPKRQHEQIKNDVEKWREFIWLPKFGATKDKSFEYTGNTLSKINETDPDGFTYWAKNYTPKPNRGKISQADQDLRTALDRATAELSKVEESGTPTVETAPQPPTAQDREVVISELEKLLLDKKIPADFVVGLLLKKGSIKPKEGQKPEEINIYDLSDNLLAQVIQHIAWFEKKHKEAQNA